MKKIFTLLLFTASFSFGYSQLRMAIMGGPQTSNVIETNNIAGWDNQVKPYYTPRSGIHVGIMVDVPITNRISFTPALLYSSQGRKYSRIYDTTLTHGDTMTYTNNFFTNYINIPLNFTVRLPLGKKANFLVSAGPYVALFYNGTHNVTSTVVTYDSIAHVHYESDQTDVQVGKGENKAKTLDFGVNGRAGFEIGNVMITGFISQGLTDFYNADYTGTFKHQVYGASLGIWLNAAKPTVKKPRDKDKDGVPDTEDACPDIPGTAAAHGCPDKDGDGIPDKTDKCPTVPGTAKYQGCPIPDRDGDGINDEEDKCPDVKGTAKYQGCPIPDRDGDGINDEEDKCPDTPGVAKYHGCPIPDTDGDGVNDEEDKCPTESGTKENNGCPVIQKEIIEKVNYEAKNIFFVMNDNKLTSASYPALDELVSILQKNPQLKLSVNGYTDNTGTPAFNLTLSQKRADAVKKYLVDHGIEAARITSTGYGKENPVADNNTEDGRSKNRRVELKLSGQ